MHARDHTPNESNEPKGTPGWGTRAGKALQTVLMEARTGCTAAAADMVAAAGTAAGTAAVAVGMAAAGTAAAAGALRAPPA